MTLSALAIAALSATANSSATPILSDDFWLPPAASTFADGLDQMFNFINWLCYFFFALITVLMVIFAAKYRAPKGHTFRMDGPTHHLPMELTWLVIPLILVIVIFWLGFAGSSRLGVEGYVGLTTAPRNSYEITAVASKWTWAFKYPNGVVSDDLYLPAGEPIKITIRSEDVLHALFIPNFRVKRDCVPGRYGMVWFQTDEPTGRSRYHHLFCAEYCGTGHSNMNRRVFVLARPDFDAWLAKEASWLDEIPAEELYFRAGPRLYPRCQTCHSLDGSRLTGPSWKGLIDRVNEGSGKFLDGKSYRDVIGPGKEFANADEYIRDSILNPQGHVVDTYSPTGMSTFKGQLNDTAIEAIIGMMKHLDEFDPKTGKWLKEGSTPAAPATTAAPAAGAEKK